MSISSGVTTTGTQFTILRKYLISATRLPSHADTNPGLGNAADLQAVTGQAAARNLGPLARQPVHHRTAAHNSCLVPAEILNTVVSSREEVIDGAGPLTGRIRQAVAGYLELPGKVSWPNLREFSWPELSGLGEEQSDVRFCGPETTLAIT